MVDPRVHRSSVEAEDVPLLRAVEVLCAIEEQLARRLLAIIYTGASDEETKPPGGAR